MQNQLDDSQYQDDFYNNDEMDKKMVMRPVYKDGKLIGWEME